MPISSASEKYCLEEHFRFVKSVTSSQSSGFITLSTFCFIYRKSCSKEFSSNLVYLLADLVGHCPPRVYFFQFYGNFFAIFDQICGWHLLEGRCPSSGGSRIFPGGGRQLPKVLLFFNFVPENCMKMKEFGPPGGGARPWRPPLDPPMPSTMNA